MKDNEETPITADNECNMIFNVDTGNDFLPVIEDESVEEVEDDLPTDLYDCVDYDLQHTIC